MKLLVKAFIEFLTYTGLKSSKNDAIDGKGNTVLGLSSPCTSQRTVSFFL